MRGGGGVDGAIHRAAGPALLRECIERFPDGLATGDAGWTTAGDLAASWVIHTVGPNYNAGERDRALLESCYRRALQIADELGARRIAFPLISAGVYGWPRADAISAAVETIAETPTRVEEVRLVAFDDDVLRHMRAVVMTRFPPPPERGRSAACSIAVSPSGVCAAIPTCGGSFARSSPIRHFPPDWFTVRSLVADAAEPIIGAPLRAGGEPVYVAAFDPGHGMSAGTVDPSWWVSTGIPILLDRYGAAPHDAGGEC